MNILKEALLPVLLQYYIKKEDILPVTSLKNVPLLSLIQSGYFIATRLS